MKYKGYNVNMEMLNVYRDLRWVLDSLKKLFWNFIGICIRGRGIKKIEIDIDFFI